MDIDNFGWFVVGLGIGMFIVNIIWASIIIF